MYRRGFTRLILPGFTILFPAPLLQTAVLCLDLIGSAVGPSSLADTLVESLSLPSPSSPPPPVPTTAGLSFSTDLLPPSGPASAEAVGVRACARSLLLSLWCVCCRDAASVWAAMCEGGWLADLHGPAVAMCVRCLFVCVC